MLHKSLYVQFQDCVELNQLSRELYVSKEEEEYG